MRGSINKIVIATLIAGQVSTPAFAQTKPAPVPVTKPAPVPEPVIQPVPLPQPVKPTPPRPVIQPPRPPQPEIQPPRPPQPVIVQPPRPVIQPPRPVPGNGGYAGTIRCDSRNNRIVRCRVAHSNRLALIDRHGGDCRANRDWGYDRRNIWVTRGCKATFAYGYGSYLPKPEKDKGPSTGLIVGGVVVAAGLIALLATRGKKKDSGDTAETETPVTYPPGPPAALSADLGSLSASQKPAMQSCLFEAAREVGVTGGTRLTLNQITDIEQGNGGWRFRANLTGSYPDGDRELPIYCRATSTKVIELDFVS